MSRNRPSTTHKDNPIVRAEVGFGIQAMASFDRSDRVVHPSKEGISNRDNSMESRIFTFLTVTNGPKCPVTIWTGWLNASASWEIRATRLPGMTNLSNQEAPASRIPQFRVWLVVVVPHRCRVRGIEQYPSKGSSPIRDHRKKTDYNSYHAEPDQTQPSYRQIRDCWATLSSHRTCRSNHPERHSFSHLKIRIHQ